MPTVLITGANRGIGHALATAYARRNHQVVATVRHPDSSGALASLGAAVTVHALEVTDDAATQALARTLADRPIDIVIANAAKLNSYGGIDDASHDAKAWAEVLMTNVAGAYFTARAFRPHLAARRGKLVLISSSMASSEAARGTAYPYRCSKAAVSNLAANLAVELKPEGIAVMALDPGWVKTDMGGRDADITVEESAAGIISRIDALSLDRSGCFENYLGQPIAY
jgi:NAD(P)-dependent dehydrogenase (short-subunit alcohol dehydrogenase family)